MYGFEVAYHKYSSVSGSAPTVEKADKQARYYVGYYKELGYAIRHARVDQACDKCNGAGSVRIKSKKGRRTHYVECPVCKGNPNTVLYEIRE